MCPKIAEIRHFGHLRDPLVAIWAQILVEQVISFKMSTETSKIGQELASEMRKMWWKYVNMLNMLKLKPSLNHSKSLILGSRDSFSSISTVLKKFIQIGRCYGLVSWKSTEMCPVSALVKFFSFWHYVPLDNDWSDHSCQFQPPNPWTRRAVAHQKKNFVVDLLQNH